MGGKATSLTASAELKGVSATKGILCFDTLETFERSYPAILKMSPAEAASWEKSIGFVSQRNIFNQINAAEYDFLIKPFENKSDDELKTLKAPKGHTDLYSKYLRAGLIKTITVDGDESYDYALPDASYTPIVNADGFYVVGKTAYQVTGDLAKEMQGADLSKLALLAKAKESSPADKITVRPAIDAAGEAAAKAGVAGCTFPLNSGWVTSGKRRGSTTVTFTATYWNPFPYKKVTIAYNVVVQSQVKNFWGNWVYASCPNECWVGGTWTLNFDYRYATTLAFAYTSYYPRSYSYPHPNCLNNLKMSINPATGATAAYPSTFVFTAPAGLAFQNVRLSPVHWSVSVPGGSSGINCSVNC